MRTKHLLLSLVAAVACALGAAPAQAQSGADSVLVYEREVFEYSRGTRPDPFRSLLKTAELGIRPEDLVLLGVMYHADPSRSIAVLAQTGAPRRIRARVGDRIGSVRFVAIGPRSVDILIEELGVTRRERLELKSAQQKGSGT